MQAQAGSATEEESRTPVPHRLAARDSEAAEPRAQVLEQRALPGVCSHSVRVQQDAHVLESRFQQLDLQLPFPHRIHHLQSHPTQTIVEGWSKKNNWILACLLPHNVPHMRRINTACAC